MAYQDLGPRYAEGKASATRNGGNWVVDFTPDIIATRLTLIECYHMFLRGPSGASFEVFRNSYAWGTSPNGFKNEWDPQQPLPLRSGDTLSFFFSTNVAPAPQVTIWLRTEKP